MRQHARFFKQFLRYPKQTGAILPSSRHLAREITSWVALERARCVVEIGPGHGAFTPFILEKVRPDATFFAIETNPSSCRSFRARFPDVPIYCDCASRIADHLDRAGLPHADCIVSGLPWASFDPDMQDELMTGIADALKPGGQFVTFAYLQGLLLPGGKRFREILDRHFARVSRSTIVWRNLPPAFVYECAKAEVADSSRCGSR
ncbi:hypothetical protein JW916_15030 [Candidatus Sumerlaeota bacterium]|nr:hypothetical protein [Candidatus Sumerlaeota bacterium]